MNPTQIKQQRLSEESTTESSTSVSGDSEADRQTDDDSSVNSTGPWATEEEFMAYISSVPEIAGRYTDADPAFRDDREQITPPILENYAPRKHDRGQGGGGYQNHYRQSQGSYGNNRGYGGHGNHYRNHNRQGDSQGQQHYNRNPRPFSAAEGGSSSSGGSSGHQSNRYPDQQRGDGGSRGMKRKSDHSHSAEPESEFYARPVGNKQPRYSNRDNQTSD